MKVVKWVSWIYNNEEFFDNFENTHSEEAFDAIVESLKENGYKFDGYYHQNGEYGCPMFDDGTVGRYTFRSWGAIMAAAYPKEGDDTDNMAYCRWAWCCPEPPVYPEGDKNVQS